MSHEHLPHNHGPLSAEIFSNLPDAEHFGLLADLFHQLGDSSRIRIFWILCHCEECVINLSAMVRMSSPAVSHHLKLLKAAGLIVSRREGKEVYYKAAATPNVQILHRAIEALTATVCPTEEK